MKKNKKIKGRLIVIDGTDGPGKDAMVGAKWGAVKYLDRTLVAAPAPSRLALLAAIADAYDEWEAAALPAAAFRPDGAYRHQRDYNLFYADVEADAALQADWQRRLARVLPSGA
jgi:hypothetical protein